MGPLQFEGLQTDAHRLPAPLLLLGVSLTLLGQVQSQQCSSAHSERLQFPDLSASFTVPVEARHDPSTMEPLYSMVGLFLDAVQPNPFPSGLLRVALNDAASIEPTQVAKYEAGFVVCAVIAGLYLVLMLLTGLIFGICRCRGKCGGTTVCYDKNLTYKRWGLILALLLTTVIMLAGVVCTLVANEKATKEMKPATQAIPSSLQGFRRFLSNIPQAVQTIVAEFSVPKQKVTMDLNSIGQTIGQSLSSKLNLTVYPLLVKVLKTAQVLEKSVRHLETLQNTTQSLQQHQGDLETALSDQRQKLSQLLNKATCVSCTDTLSRVPRLELGANFSKVPAVDHVLHKLESATGINMTGIFQMAIQDFSDIPQTVDNESAEDVRNILEALDKAEKEVQGIAAEFQIQQYTASLNKGLLEAEDLSTMYGDDVQRYDHYRWIVGIILCCVVLFVIACNFLGLVFGIWGLYVRGDPTMETCQGETGAALLMSGVGFSFLFSWALILMVFVTFFVGGNVQKLVCKSWAKGNLYKFMDEPGNLPPSLNLTTLLGLKENFNISSVYQKCKEGALFWDILQLNNTYDLQDALNISKYTGEFQKNIDNLTIGSDQFPIMSNIAVFWLGEFNASGSDQIRFSIFKAEIETPLVKMSLEEFAAELDRLQAAQTNTTLQAQLTGAAAALRDLQSSMVQAQAADVQRLNESVQFLAAIAPTIQPSTDGALTDLRYMETFMAVDAQQLLRNETECFMRKEIGYFSQYVDWVNRTIMHHVASCQPVSTSLDNVRVALCENAIQPWNAFWFCLGWCTLFLIPSIIFAVKTSKYFRPIRRRLSFHYSEEETLFRIPRVTSLNM